MATFLVGAFFATLEEVDVFLVGIVLSVSVDVAMLVLVASF
ncbi:hypothetical protein [Polynucleobacter sp. UK-Kesae-W10]|nr:hypothetical protein [Polynucleobacter sp. UK-Kesae-W10]